MNVIQRFALENIYCSPGQDYQYSFSLIRVNNANQPVTGSIMVYGGIKQLPSNNMFHVFTIGNLNPGILNLLKQDREWYKDTWVQVSADMVARNYIMKVYNQDGSIYPRQNLFYSFINESSLIIALEFTPVMSNVYNITSYSYMHVYSNSYFNTTEYLSLSVNNGIKYGFNIVNNNADKVALQTLIYGYEINGGKAIIYVNGYYTDNLNLNITNGSYIEFVYDQSIISKEKFVIGNLRSFNSTKDSINKYLVFRDKVINTIQFKDDIELYISNDNQLVTKGLFYYQHNDNSARNVTDKDFSLNATYVNNTAQAITNLTNGTIQDKVVVLYTRKAGATKALIYSSLKIHELYKLPLAKGLDVVSNTNYTIPDFRAETLENSDYFNVASLNGLKNLTVDMAYNAAGYSGVAYYFANTPVKPIGSNTYVNVPVLYQSASTAFEYNVYGEFLGKYLTTGPIYPLTNITATNVEFIYGQTPINYGHLLSNTEAITLLHNEFVVLSALFTGVTRTSVWEDITNISSRCNVVGNTLTITETPGHKIKIVYLNQPNTYDTQVHLSGGSLYFPLTINEDRGTGIQTHIVDVPYTNIEIYLNKNKLAPGIDYFINFPYVSICNKEYLNQASDLQDIHVRMYGHTLNVADINSEEKTGFVSSGVLLRNNSYDIRDDRVMSVYIKGRLYDRDNVLFAETDNTVRVNSNINGLPYVIKEPFIPVKSLTERDTLSHYVDNVAVNKRISDLFNLIFPEPSITDNDIIATKYRIVSPTVNNIITDMKSNVIPATLYTNPYNDTTIINLLNQTPYKEILALDPVKSSLPLNIIEIQPIYSNISTTLTLMQSRFINDVIRIITNNNSVTVTTGTLITVVP